MARRKISAVQNDFDRSILNIRRFDKKNQQTTGFSNNQIEMLTEGLFLSAFRAFENFIEETFLLYTLEKPSLTGKRPTSFLKPKNFDHSRSLIKSSMPFLDWSSADNIIERAETYLADGAPIKSGIAGARGELQNMKVLRNQIAHNSTESLVQYERMLRRTYGTAPLNLFSPGRHLLNIVPNISPSQHFLHYYLDRLGGVAFNVNN